MVPEPFVAVLKIHVVSALSSTPSPSTLKVLMPMPMVIIMNMLRPLLALSPLRTLLLVEIVRVLLIQMSVSQL